MMPLSYIQGSLLDSEDKVIVHGCNALGKFASGVAGIVRKQYPEAYNAYMHAHENKKLIPGSIIWAKSQNKIIANAITQPTYGRDAFKVYVDYNAVRICIRTLNEICIRSQNEEVIKNWFGEAITSVSMPFIGIGLGNGNPDIISSIIEEEAKDINVSIYVLPVINNSIGNFK